MAEAVDLQIRRLPELRHTGDFVVDVAGEIVWESHYQPGHLRDLFSMTKTVVGRLVGMAVADGAASLTDEVEDEVTVRHLLTMTRGVAADIEDIDAIQELPSGWVRAIRDRPRLEPPGQVFRYDNCASHLLAAWLADTIGSDLERFAADRLFAPLGIETWEWPEDPEGYHYGFAHLRLPVTGLLALGRMMLAGGAAPDDAQLVPRRWVDEMTTPSSGGSAFQEACRASADDRRHRR